MDALKMFRREGWHTLADNTCVQLAQCQKLLAVATSLPLSHGQKLLTCQHKYPLAAECVSIISEQVRSFGRTNAQNRPSNRPFIQLWSCYINSDHSIYMTALSQGAQEISQY